ncbi:MAG TPA: TetR/AcrR family transcriptional regulator [Frankiaceae bacterium]|nr:TetR/AcrR family transcriptional regulator [Frankiaceae bacterium]
MSSPPVVPAHRPSGGGRRDAIIDVAADRFAQQGFHGVSMRDIAKANGSSVAALYNHFASKDDLLLAVGERFFSVFVDHLEAAAAGPGDGLSRFFSMVRITFSDGCTYRNEYLTISRDNRHVATVPELAPLVSARNACVAIWNRVLLEGIRDGSIQPGLDPAAVVWIVFSAVTGMVDVDRAAVFTGAFAQDPFRSLSALLQDGLKPRS